MRKRSILFAGFVARMEEELLPQRVIFGDFVGGRGDSGGQGKDWMDHLKTPQVISMLRPLSAVIAPPKYSNSIVRLYTWPAALIVKDTFPTAFGFQAHYLRFCLGYRKPERRARRHDHRHHPLQPF